MKVQTKIALLIVLVMATFMTGRWGLRAYDKWKVHGITQERVKERNRAFDAFLEKDGEPLKTFAEYDAYWDQMVQAIEKDDERWFNENLNGSTLAGYKANAVWIYGPDGTLIHSNNNTDTQPQPLPIPREAL